MNALLDHSGEPITLGGQVGYLIPATATTEQLAADASMWLDTAGRILGHAADDDQITAGIAQDTINAGLVLACLAQSCLSGIEAIALRDRLAKEAKQ